MDDAVTKLVELTIGMCTDYLLDIGPTDAALVNNLRLIAGQLEQALKGEVTK